ncbi:MAG: hypothetical protein IKV53_02610, partial [Clostridia bacterium]|nr:hypothetical protein [Clostridia bacterium]
MKIGLLHIEGVRFFPLEEAKGNDVCFANEAFGGDINSFGICDIYLLGFLRVNIRYVADATR